jgi:hypothetical protein
MVASMPLNTPLSPPLAALVGAFGALLVAALVLVLGGAVLRWRARRLAVAARSSLGPARDDLEGLDEDGACVTLTGTLDSLGTGCARFEDGASVAVATAAGELGAPESPPALTVRAERLRLKMRDEIVEIVGPVEVLGGARESRPGGYQELRPQPRRRLREAAEGGPAPAGDLELRSLRAGDRVRVAGVLLRVDAAKSASGYREAAPYTLVAAGGAPAVILAFEGAPRASGPVVAGLAGVRVRQDLVASAGLLFALGAACGFGASLWWAKAPASACAHEETGTCRDRAACDDAMPIVQSLRPW